MRPIEKWIKGHFAPGVLPPFSFIYDGQPSSRLLKDWRFHQEIKTVADTKTEYVFTYSDPQTGLQVCCTCEVFEDFPAAEWVLKLKNDGNQETPIIENIQALDAMWSFEIDGEILLHHALGSSASRTDFAPVDEVMPTDQEIRFAPIGGRSSNTTALPFFNVESQGEGLFLGVGWSGQWAASLMRAGDRRLEMRAGMELTHLKLHPGEQIRTPRILLLHWQGDDRMIGHNLFRRFILAHHTLEKDGKPVTTPFACNGGPRMFDESNNATVHNQIALAERYRQFGLDTEYWWIDAGYR